MFRTHANFFTALASLMSISYSLLSGSPACSQQHTGTEPARPKSDLSLPGKHSKPAADVAACGKPIPAGKRQSSVDSWLNVAIGLFVEKPDQFVVTESRRTVSAHDPLDAVLKIPGKTGLDLTPVCHQMKSGSYTLAIAGTGNSPGQLVGPTPLTISEAKPVLLSGPPLKSGLYTVQPKADPDEPFGLDKAWILVCDERNYEQRLDAFKKAE
jgi:hypothetical protein